MSVFLYLDCKLLNVLNSQGYVIVYYISHVRVILHEDYKHVDLHTDEED